MILLLGFAFLSGLVTILAPCIWPLLPIVLSSSIAGKGHQRPLGITLGIMLSFTIFTLSISYLVKFFHVDPNIFRVIAVVVIAFLGLAMIVPTLTKILELSVSRLSGMWGIGGGKQKSGFGGGFITGLSLGVVWSPCAGPILAAIAALAATGQVTSTVVLITVAYVTGVGIPLFAFAYGGHKVAARSRLLNKYTGRIQQIFGVIMILTALAIYTNYDKVIQAKLLDVFPQFSNLVKLEGNEEINKQLQNLKRQQTQGSSNVGLEDKGKAPEFIGISHWINSEPLKLKDLKGKVVLVDFWTYTCINCIRTLPHVTSWYDKYKDKGFVVIGVHTPEFEFEKDTKNVENAIQQYNIYYPVAQDNNYATWTNYNNRYWPAEYLIDANGTIRLTHFGEGNYEETEKAIIALLKENGASFTESIQKITDETPQGNISQETYLGSQRAQFYYPNGQITNGTKEFKLPSNPPLHTVALGGSWTVEDDKIVAGAHAALAIHCQASKVFLVLRPPGSGQAKVKVFLDGKTIDPQKNGADVKEGVVTIDTDRLYHLVDLQGKIEDHILRLEFETPGTKAFVFTFG